MALGAFPPFVTLGDVRLCSDCAISLVRTVTSLSQQVSSFVQYVLMGTAFLESVRLQETLALPSEDLIEYMPVAHPGGRRGMRIEARCGNLPESLWRFAYFEGVQKPVVHLSRTDRTGFEEHQLDDRARGDIGYRRIQRRWEDDSREGACRW